MIPPITDLEIGDIREDVASAILDMTCNVQRNTPGGVDTHNQPLPGTWASIATAIACHYWEAEETEEVGQPNATVTRERLLLPPNTDVTTRDRITSVIGYDGTQIKTNLDILEVLIEPFDTLLIVRSID